MTLKRYAVSNMNNYYQVLSRLWLAGWACHLGFPGWHTQAKCYKKMHGCTET